MSGNTIQPADVDGNLLALLLDADADNVAVSVGRASWDGIALHWDGAAGHLEIPENALGRLRAVTQDLDGIFDGAKYFVTLSVGPLPKGANESGLFQKTGLIWPKDDGEAK